MYRFRYQGGRSNPTGVGAEGGEDAIKGDDKKVKIVISKIVKRIGK